VAKDSPIQTSFNAGELSPRMEGRVDVDKYGAGVSKLENFLPLVQGGALKRSGTRFVKAVKDSTALTRLIPFEFSTTQAYILEFGNLYMRVYRNDGVVLNANLTISDVANTTPIRITTSTVHGYSTGDQVFIAGTGIAAIDNKFFDITVFDTDEFDLDGTAAAGAAAAGTSGRVFELVTPYTTADLEALATVQSADVLYIAHPDFNPRKLERTDHDVWTITSIDFDFQPFAPENLDDQSRVNASAVTGTGITLTSGDGIFTSAMVNGYFKLREIVQSHRGEWEAGTNQTLYNSVFVLGDEVFFESNVYEFVELAAGAGLTGTSAPVHEVGTELDGQFNWLYLHSGEGYVQITAFTNANRVTATVIRQLPSGTVHADVVISGATQADPVVVTANGHLIREGDQVWIQDVVGMTEINNRKFTVGEVLDVNRFELKDEDGRGHTLYSSAGIVVELSTDLWAHGAWGGSNGFPRALTFFEDRLWFAGAAGNLQTMWASRTGEYEDHKVTDTDVSALQFTLNTDTVNVIEWMNAGKKLVIGTAGGEFVVENTDPITPNNPPNIARNTAYGSKSQVQPKRIEQVLLFVQRAGRKIREYVSDFDTNSFVGPDMNALADHILLDRIKKMDFQQEPNRLLWCVLEDGELVCFTYERSQDVTAWHHHPIGGDTVLVESVAVIPHQDGDRDQVWLIVNRQVNSGTKRYIEFFEEDWLRSAAMNTAFFVDSGLSRTSGGPTTSIIGLDHLEGETVKVIGDGIVQADQVVSSGAITITSASVVHVGLSYESVLRQLRLEAGAGDGTAQGKTQRITNVVVRLDQTGRGLQIGPNDTDANMEEVGVNDGERIPQTGALADLIDGDTDIMPFPEGYSQEARVTLKHNEPLPCTIIAIMPQVVVQDR